MKKRKVKSAEFLIGINLAGASVMSVSLDEGAGLNRCDDLELFEDGWLYVKHTGRLQGNVLTKEVLLPHGVIKLVLLQPEDEPSRDKLKV